MVERVELKRGTGIISHWGGVVVDTLGSSVVSVPESSDGIDGITDGVCYEES